MRRLMQTLFAATSLVVVSTASAHTFCVDTAAALQNAFDAAADSGAYNGEDNVVYVKTGTYQTGSATGNGPFHFYSSAGHALYIYGGYSGTNCPSYQYVAALTTLDGHGSSDVLTLANPNGRLLVENLRIVNGSGPGPGAGLQINYLVPVSQFVIVTNVIIEGNHSSGTAGGLYMSGGGSESDLVGSLIANNSADGDYGGGYFTAFGTPGSVVANNTVTRNTSAAASNAVGGLYIGGTSNWFAANNIFWNNTGVGLYLNNSTAQLEYNDYGSLGGMAPTTEFKDVSVNPKFVDTLNGNFRLSGTSPLLGVSPVQTSLADLDGHPRPLGGKADVGAYFETIFIDGFDGN